MPAASLSTEPARVEAASEAMLAVAVWPDAAATRRVSVEAAAPLSPAARALVKPPRAAVVGVSSAVMACSAAGLRGQESEWRGKGRWACARRG